jgi:peptidoglycan hydrolase-like protein with peptidoglycan-binding domain
VDAAQLTYISERSEKPMAHVPPTLKQGSKGDAVKGLQNALKARGYEFGAVDGVFGSATTEAVKQFQREFGLEEDGIAGPDTWQALNVYVVQSGDTLSDIAQQQLGRADSWPDIFELNRALISDPDKIVPGQVLALPLGD